MNSLTGLIVEDSPLTRARLKAVLEAQKCKTYAASSGEEAVKLLNKGIVVHFAIVDMKLPLMNGSDVIRIMQKNKDWKKIIVFPYSALWNDQEDIPRLEILEEFENWEKITDIFYQKDSGKNINPVVGKPHGYENSNLINPKLIYDLTTFFKTKGLPLTPSFKKIARESLGVV